MLRTMLSCRRPHQRAAIIPLVVALAWQGGCGGETSTAPETVPAGVKNMQDFVKAKHAQKKGAPGKAKSAGRAAN
jgi:hypothetical protein